MSDMPAAHLTLRTYKLPRNLSPTRAMDVALALTGHRRVSDLARYIAMALHYASWSLEEATLSEYEVLLSSMNAEHGTQLLDAMSFQPVFLLRAEHDGLPPAAVRRSQAAAKEWRRSLSAKDIDPLRLHRRALVLLEKTLSCGEDAQRMLVAELQVATMAKEQEADPSVAQPGADQTAGADPSSRRAGGAAHPGGRAAIMFARPGDALAFILHNAGMNPTNLAAMFAAGAAGAPVALPGAQAAADAVEPSAAAPGTPAKPAARPAITGPRVRVFSPAEAYGVLQRMPAPSPNEGNSQQRRVLEAMMNDMGQRALSETPEGDPLAELYARFPHFADVLDCVSRYLAMAACGSVGRPSRIPPLLLRSAPGVGKSYFAQELARVLQAEFVKRDLAVASEAFVLSGMDPGWKGSKPGVVFDALVNGKTANPVIFLDEVDKARVTGTHSSPLAALYTLLEPSSSERFQDEFIPVSLDASNIIWVLAANDGDIPEPILSRCETFDIPKPTLEQSRAIAQSVWDSIRTKSLPAGHGFAEELPVEVLNAVTCLSPREMRRSLTRAVGEAAYQGRKHLIREDLDSLSRTAGKSRGIGFLAPMNA